tara:strand:+ start:93 stop:473 length:381 start_codon:yes stop_codon:yes gene_type:complete
MKITRHSGKTARAELTTGTHHATIIECEETESKKGNSMLKLKLEVGRVKKWMFYYVVVASYRMNDFLDAMNFDGEEIDSEDFIGKSCMAEVITEEWNGSEQLKIDVLTTTGEGAPLEGDDDDSIPF